MKYYFAYGSNMDQEDLSAWCAGRGYAPVILRNPRMAELRGYRLDFNYYSTSRASGAANIMPADGSSVFGIVVELADDDFAAIRAKEGWPGSYREMLLPVHAGDEIVNALTYKVDSVMQCAYTPPSRYFRVLIIAAARRYGFPQWYRDALEDVPVWEEIGGV